MEKSINGSPLKTWKGYYEGKYPDTSFGPVPQDYSQNAEVSRGRKVLRKVIKTAKKVGTGLSKVGKSVAHQLHSFLLRASEDKRTHLERAKHAGHSYTSKNKYFLESDAVQQKELDDRNKKMYNRLKERFTMENIEKLSRFHENIKSKNNRNEIIHDIVGKYPEQKKPEVKSGVSMTDAEIKRLHKEMLKEMGNPHKVRYNSHGISAEQYLNAEMAKNSSNPNKPKIISYYPYSRNFLESSSSPVNQYSEVKIDLLKQIMDKQELYKTTKQEFEKTKKEFKNSKEELENNYSIPLSHKLDIIREEMEELQREYGYIKKKDDEVFKAAESHKKVLFVPPIKRREIKGQKKEIIIEGNNGNNGNSKDPVKPIFVNQKVNPFKNSVKVDLNQEKARSSTNNLLPNYNKNPNKTVPNINSNSRKANLSHLYNTRINTNPPDVDLEKANLISEYFKYLNEFRKRKKTKKRGI